MKQKLKSGDEYDFFSRWRHYLRWSKGQRKRLKRAVNKRIRKEGKRESIND